MTASPERSTAASASDGLTGHLLGERYELGRRLGEGGMGVVYQAKDRRLSRTVAVKVFRDGTTGLARTTSEKHLLAGLSHPALVTLHDAHVEGEAPRYLVMEYVDGPTLQTRLARGPLSARSVLRVADDLSEALIAVHAAGIVHRDVKPANVLLRSSHVPGEEFRAKLADFGIARLVDTTRVTVPGAVIGSAAYLSPEQVTGATPLPASDIYSLGLVLLETLTGRRAFAQDGLHEAALARLTQDPVIPSSVGADWGALLTAMTARDPADRPSAIDVSARVRRLDSEAAAASDATITQTAVLPPSAESMPAQGAVPAPRRRRLRRPVVAALVAAVVVIAGGALWGALRSEPTAPPALPSVEEPLATHLQQLMDAVSP